MKKNVTFFLILFISIAGSSNFLKAQDYLFFTDSDDPNFYDPSFLFVTSPSMLEKYNNDVKFPVSTSTLYSGTNSLKLKWTSVAGGNWGAAIAAPGWPGRDITLKDTLSLWVYSEASIDTIPFPRIYLEDLSNSKTDKINLTGYIPNINAGEWTNLKIPIQLFKDNPGAADLTRIKVIYFGQGLDDGIEHTLYIDEVKMTGGSSIDDFSTIVVLGSSTAAGIGPSVIDSAWVWRLRTYLQNTDTTFKVTNLAVGGYSTYDIMPTGFVPPQGRRSPKPSNNVTFALTLNPVAIIVNLPSNDAAYNYPIAEQIANYDTIVAITQMNDIPLWITTTQPRNFSLAQRNNLIIMRDSTYSRYGTIAIDFWTDIALSDGTINPIFNSGDGIHLNNSGHRILFERILSTAVPKILPVELKTFTAKVENNSVILNWVTATEINNRGFEVQRKNKEKDFYTVAFVNGKGTTTESQYYSFADKNIGSGEYSYKLKQIDFNGSFEFSNEIEITINLIPEKFALYQNYPNPFNPSTKIRYSVPSNKNPLLGGAGGGFVTLKIYDILGNEVATLINEEQQPGNYEVEFNAKNFASGVYVYKLNADNFVSNKKMILMK